MIYLILSLITITFAQTVYILNGSTIIEEMKYKLLSLAPNNYYICIHISFMNYYNYYKTEVVK